MLLLIAAQGTVHFRTEVDTNGLLTDRIATVECRNSVLPHAGNRMTTVGIEIVQQRSEAPFASLKVLESTVLARY